MCYCYPMRRVLHTLFSARANYLFLLFFFFNDTAPPEIYTLSLHDALPISRPGTPACTPLPASRSSRGGTGGTRPSDRKSTRLNSSHLGISYAVFCLKKKNEKVT